MDVAVKSNIIADRAMPLNVRKGADLELLTGNRIFPDGYAMSGSEPCAYSRAGVKYAVRPDMRAPPDHEPIVLGQRAWDAQFAERFHPAALAEFDSRMDD